MLWAVVLGCLAGGCAVAWSYDVRQRRRGVRLRAGGAILDEAVHSRIDLDAPPYEPARHAGQHDWATYRRRERNRGRPPTDIGRED